MRSALPTIALFALIAAACTGGSVSTTQGAGTSGSPAAFDLTHTHEITGFGYTIDYPPAWFANTRNTVTVIAELEEDVEQALASDTPQPFAGVTIQLDHRPLSFMEDLGLPSDNPTNEDLLELNIGLFEWTEIVDRSQVTVFGVPAFAVRATSRFGQPMVAVQAVRPDEDDIFLLTIKAPTEVALLEVLPTWEAMMASIRPSAETPLSETVLAGSFDVGGFELFITCAGKGAPTVVFD